jgi:flotillin
VAIQDKLGSIGESEARKDKDIQVANNDASAQKGIKKAEAEKRCYVADQESLAIKGENEAKQTIALSNAELKVIEAEAFRKAEVAKREAEVEIQKAQYSAEKQRLNAAEVAKQEIDKQKIIIEAEAAAEKARQIAQGDADAILFKYKAEAEGQKALLEAKAEGYKRLVQSAGDDVNAASTLLMIEKLQDIVTLQTEAIRNIKIDKVTVWDRGNGSGDGKTSTADFLSGMVKSLPPLHDVAKMAGLQLPTYLGSVGGKEEQAAAQAAAAATAAPKANPKA